MSTKLGLLMLSSALDLIRLDASYDFSASNFESSLKSLPIVKDKNQINKTYHVQSCDWLN